MKKPKVGMVLLLSALVLSACASPTAEYPSLALRPNELPGAAAPASGATTSGVNEDGMDQSELQGRLAQLEEQARAAHAAFMGKSRNVSGLINAARGANVTNLAWGNAQVALADLDSHRSQTAIALADADLLYADRAVALASRQNIAKTRDLISALLDEEDRVLAQLRRGLEQ